jgi:hypothetical protein
MSQGEIFGEQGDVLDMGFAPFCKISPCTPKMPPCDIVLKKTPWSEYEGELYRPSDRRLSAK